MRASVALLTVFLAPVLVAGDDECQLGTNRTATADPQWFDGGEVQGFIIPNGNFQMCFFNPAINKDCQGISDFFKHCGENCTQHSMEETVIKLSNTTWLVNIRMLEPSTTKDEAYVIRVYNNTLVYMAEGPCSATEHLYEDWSPKLLLQRPSLSTNTPPTTDESKGSLLSQKGEISSVSLAILILVLLLVLGILLAIICKMKYSRSAGAERPDVENAPDHKTVTDQTSSQIPP